MCSNGCAMGSCGMGCVHANLVDSTGHKPGVTTGSFRPSAEREWASLRPTAAAERAKLAAKR